MQRQGQGPQGTAQCVPAGSGAKRDTHGLGACIIPFDGVSLTIAVLSFIAVTLIVQGFIKTRASIFMPAASVEAIEQMIQGRQHRELLEFTESDPSFVSQALNPALKRAPSFNAPSSATG